MESTTPIVGTVDGSRPLHHGSHAAVPPRVRHSVSRTRIELWSALAIVYAVWGSTYLGIKVAVRTLPPFLTAGTRFLAAAAILAAVLALRPAWRLVRRR